MAASCDLFVSAASLLLLLATASAGSNTSACLHLADCPNYRMINFYEELGCVRNDGSTGCCPTSFNCSSIMSLDDLKCYYDKKTYEVGERIIPKSPCVSVCNCGTREGEASVHCDYPECLRFVSSDPHCYNERSLDACCGVGFKCANDTKSPRNVTECVYDGKTYLEGQEMPARPCERCVCQEGYDGTLNGPWCRRLNCDLLLWLKLNELQQGCAPLLHDSCCSYGIHCPSDYEYIERNSEPLTGNGGAQCSYGNHTLNIGDRISDYPFDYISCICEIPPFVTCRDRLTLPPYLSDYRK